MPSTPKPFTSDLISRARELENDARNEQQKSLLLSVVARTEASVDSPRLLKKNYELVQQSCRLMERSKALRNHRRSPR